MRMATAKTRAAEPPKRIRTRVEEATVTLPRYGGRGVLVAGGFILTAAHCINHYNSGGMVLGDWCLEGFKAADGTRHISQVCAVEAATDIAVLGGPDDQAFCDEAEAFEAFASGRRPVRLFRGPAPAWHKPFPVWVYGKGNKWFPATATRYGRRSEEHVPFLCLETERRRAIRSGDSGSPVIDREGLLVGIVSNGNVVGSMPFPPQALPAWIVGRIVNAESEL